MASQPDVAVADTTVEAPLQDVAKPSTATAGLADAMYGEDAPEPEKGEGYQAPDEGVREVETGEDGEAQSESEDTAPDLPAIEAPRSWTAADKEVFGNLPREAQEVIARRQTESDRHLHSKTQELAKTRDQVTSQARNILAEAQRDYAQRLAGYAQMFEAPAPNPELLTAGNTLEERVHYQGIYQQQALAHQQAAEQRNRATLAAQEAFGHYQETISAETAAEEQRQFAEIVEAFPEWETEEGRATVEAKLHPTARLLGYTPELVKQANAADLKALELATEWKAKADQLDKLNKAKMIPVRQARQLPKVMQPGAAGTGPSKTQSLASIMYPND